MAEQRVITDTERVDWLEEKQADLRCHRGYTQLPTWELRCLHGGYGLNLRDLIDAAMREDDNG